MLNRRVLVVGTTSDYIEIIRRRYPGRSLFITDSGERAKASEPCPASREELVCDLRKPERAVGALREHLERWRMEAAGTVCFDCESMSLASFISQSFGLCYPSAESIAACRSKYVSKDIWRRGGLPCPRVRLVREASEVLNFFRCAGGPVVLKPLTGSGSEFVFLCSNEEECAGAFVRLKSGLAKHWNERMYARYVFEGEEIDPRKVFVVEEFIEGEEYSCDFLVDGDKVEIIRLTRKIPEPSETFGTTLGYVFLTEYPAALAGKDFGEQLLKAARVLGLERAICMVDFVMRDDEAFMIELTPRPGGDCLPELVLKSSGVDILGSALDFAEGQFLRFPKASQGKSLVGVRLFSPQSGEIERVDCSDLSKDDRVVECHLKRGAGHRVVLPPAEYESRILGHVIFKPKDFESIEKQCVEISSKLKVEMKRQACARVN